MEKMLDMRGEGGKVIFSFVVGEGSAEFTPTQAGHTAGPCQ